VADFKKKVLVWDEDSKTNKEYAADSKETTFVEAFKEALMPQAQARELDKARSDWDRQYKKKRK